jgi:hypothetical protein
MLAVMDRMYVVAQTLFFVSLTAAGFYAAFRERTGRRLQQATRVDRNAR